MCAVTCSRVCLQQTNGASICSSFQRCSLCFVSIKENEKAVVALKSWTLPLLFVSCCCWWGLSRSIMGDGLYVCLPEPTACCCRGSLHYDAVRPCFSWLTDRAAVIRLHQPGAAPLCGPAVYQRPASSVSPLVCLLSSCLTGPTPRAPLTQRCSPVPVNQTQ